MTEIKPFIKKLIVYALLILLCFLLQTSVFSHLELAGVTPNLMLIPVSFFGFLRKLVWTVCSDLSVYRIS